MAKKCRATPDLSEDYIIKADLRVKLPQFMKELQRSRGLTTGRLDARFSGPTTTCSASSLNTIRRTLRSPDAFMAAFNMLCSRRI